jgi:hypothetical protein
MKEWLFEYALCKVQVKAASIRKNRLDFAGFSIGQGKIIED